ncbi:MAG: hypothetical protein JW841_13595 [Deltaproteobacteria bacterium]|nr:hypothetical protein [Deltaproteobacteria bacterium]
MRDIILIRLKRLICECRAFVLLAIVFVCNSTTIFAQETPTNAQNENTTESDQALTKVAIFPLLKEGSPNNAVFRAISESINSIASSVAVVKILVGDTLQQELNTSPQTALLACKEDIYCISGLGKKIGAAEILVGQVRESGSGASLMFIAFPSEGASALRKVRVEVPDTKTAQKVINENIYAILGIDTPGFVEINTENSDVDIQIDGTLVGKGRGPFQASPGRHIVHIDAVKHEVLVKPEQTTTITPSADEITLALTPLPAGSIKIKEKGPPPWSKMRWTSVAFAAGSLVALATGGVFYIKKKAAKDKISGSTTQKQAIAKNRDADRYTEYTNNCLYISAGLFGIGAILWGIDIVAAPVVLPDGTPSGVQASISTSF